MTGRLIWLVLIWIHIGVALTSGAAGWRGDSPATVAAAILLALSISFFALKVLDAPFLRIKSRRGAVIGILAAVILHHNAIERFSADCPPAVTAGVITATCFFGCSRRRGFLKRLSNALRSMSAIDVLQLNSELSRHVVVATARELGLQRLRARAPPQVNPG